MQYRPTLGVVERGASVYQSQKEGQRERTRYRLKPQPPAQLPEKNEDDYDPYPGKNEDDYDHYPRYPEIVSNHTAEQALLTCHIRVRALRTSPSYVSYRPAKATAFAFLEKIFPATRTFLRRSWLYLFSFANYNLEKYLEKRENKYLEKRENKYTTIKNLLLNLLFSRYNLK